MPNWWCPTECGTLNLSHPDAAHCFPSDGSKFTICCENIKLPGPGENAMYDESDLAERIRAASHPSNPSWCVCNNFVCEELLGGTVSWDQQSCKNFPCPKVLVRGLCVA